MFQLKFRTPLMASMIVGLFYAQGAKADEVITRVIKTTTTDAAVPVQDIQTTSTTTERKTLITGPGATTVVTQSYLPLNMGEAQDILRTVELRRNELDKQIVDDRAAGTLNEAQAASLRREMDQIGAEVTFLKQQPSPSLLRSIALAQDLDSLATNLKTTVTTVTFVPIIQGSHFVVFNGTVVQLDDLAVRRIELENKILAAQVAGRVSFDSANRMRNELNAIAALEDVYKVNGQLTPKNSREFYRDMDKVANELDSVTR